MVQDKRFDHTCWVENAKKTKPIAKANTEITRKIKGEKRIHTCIQRGTRSPGDRLIDNYQLSFMRCTDGLTTELASKLEPG
jgi:hypothetical protein